MKEAPCLHCAIMQTIDLWVRVHGERRNGDAVLDVSEVIGKLAECLVEVTQMPEDRSDQRSAFRFAHDALDAALKAHITGEVVPVEIRAEN